MNPAMNIATNVAADPTVTNGVVTDVDAYAVTVLVGEHEEEWTFPLALVPGAVETGDIVKIGYEDGRPVVLPETHDLTVEGRLTRPLNRRRFIDLTD